VQQYNNTTSMRMMLPPLLYVATDTPALGELLRQHSRLPIVEWRQARVEHGVLLGQATQVRHLTRTECVQRWRDTVTDLMLLSHANVVIAGRPSSFVQTLPMSLALGRRQPKQNQLPVSYCEVMGDAAEQMQCFGSYREWCCEHETWIAEGKEFVRFVPVGAPFPTPPILKRPADASSCYPRPGMRAKQWCLPHEWKPF